MTPTTPDAEAPALPAKCRQILDGARRAFLAGGFEATSMGEIAREAGVSKGTLYVYFDSKEALFTALVEETKRHSAERLVPLDSRGDDVAAALTDFACALILRMTHPEHVQLLRMVVAAAERIPGPARSFYAAGPAHGVALVAAYLRDLTAAGRMAVADPERAAWTFLSILLHPLMTGMLLGGAPAPDESGARDMAARAVETFLAAYPLPRP